MSEIKDALGKIENEFKSQQSEMAGKIEKYGADSAEVKNQLAQIEKGLGEQMDKVKAQQESLQKGLDGVTTALNRNADALGGKKEVSADVMAMRNFITKGAIGGDNFGGSVKEVTLSSKGLSVGSDPNGGYFVDPVFGEMFDETMTEFSPLRQLAEVIKISKGDQLSRLINKKGGTGFSWESEAQTSSDTGNPTVGRQIIPVHSGRASIFISQQGLEDIEGAEEWLMKEAAEDFATGQNSAYFSGDGVGKPRGLLTYGSSEISQIASGSASTFTTDGLLSLMGALKAPYRANATFLANRSSIFTHLFTLKDGENRNFLVPDFRNGLTFRLVGTPLMEATDMPDVTGDALPLAYGDFRRAYTIVDRKDMTVLRDPYSNKPDVEFWVGGRFGGDVKIKEAIALQTISAS